MLAGTQFLQPQRLLELAELDVLAIAELPAEVHVQPLFRPGVITGHPLERAGTLALQHQLDAADARRGVASQVGHVAVEPVGVGLHHAFESHSGRPDGAQRHFGPGRGDRREQGEQGDQAVRVCHGVVDAVTAVGAQRKTEILQGNDTLS